MKSVCRGIALLLPLLLSGCPSASGRCEPSAGQALERWQPVCTLLDDTEWLKNGTVRLGDERGTLLSWSRGDITAQTPVEIASATKWLSSATLLSLVDEGTLELDAPLSDHLAFISTDPNDPESEITLRHALSFTTGIQVRPAERTCVRDGDVTLAACAAELLQSRLVSRPGAVFYYGPAHLHLAGAAAQQATGESFERLFRSRVGDVVGMSEQTTYARTSPSNPWVSGGVTSTVEDYERFLLALLRGELLALWQDEMHRDHTPSGEVELGYSPLEPLAQQWHYGLGSWLECNAPVYGEWCAAAQIVSSPGAYGFHPWIDRAQRRYGIIGVRRSALFGASFDSVRLAQRLRPLVDEALAP